MFDPITKIVLTTTLFSPIQSQGYLIENISPEGTLAGTVVAGTSKHLPNYWYHWTRDAALVMDVLLLQYKNGDEKTKQSLLPLFWDYIALSKQHQNTPNLSRGHGEPKFHVDGAAFNEPWGRPQNDGPALRALTLVRFALALENQEQAYEIYHSVIKNDLNFTLKNWKDPNYDLWEEVKGDHFYTKMVQRKALVEGAKLATLLGDPDSENYQKEVGNIEASILQHFSPKNTIIPTLNRVEGLEWKESDLDSAVILAILHTFSQDDPFLLPTDEHVLKTAHQLKTVFKEIYLINQDGHPGIAIGRYPEDRYDGVDFSEGHPWFLLTFAFGEYYFTVANILEGNQEISITDATLPFFKELVPLLDRPSVVTPADPQFKEIIDNMRSLGNFFVERGMRHGSSDGRFSEQFDRKTGAMRGAENLTWSYANLMRADFARIKREKSLVNP